MNDRFTDVESVWVVGLYSAYVGQIHNIKFLGNLRRELNVNFSAEAWHI